MPNLALTTAIGSPFDVRRVSVHEAASTPFTIDILVVSRLFNVDLEAVVGQSASFTATTGYENVVGGSRTWTGVVSTIEQVEAMLTGRDGNDPVSTYFIRLVPQLWLLTQRTNHRIFQRQSIPDIIDELLVKDWSITPDWHIDRASYPKLEYKCQYGETDYAFFSRMLEEAGINFLLMDQKGETKLVLSDNPTVSPLREAPAIHFEDQPTENRQHEYATKLRLKHDVRPGAFQLVDFDFRNPSFHLSGEAKKARKPEEAYEQFENKPGAFLIEGKGGAPTPRADDKGSYRYDPTYGQKRAQAHLEADRSGKRLVAFETNVLNLQPGTVTNIEGHPHEALKEKLLVTSFELSAEPNQRWSMNVQAVFTAEPFRPSLTTPKPTVKGVQSATVVGKPGQEIDPDEFGRVRVQFPWDRKNKFDDTSSVWIRVSQGWAGTGFGMINIPRIGQEVLVGFLDGDPDDPIIVGRVFNAVNPVPYKLPDNMTISGWKTHSSPSNGGYNEIKLEDRADKELVYIQAQRDLHELVKRDETHRIERKHHRTVVDDQHFIAKKNKLELVVENDHLHVQKDRFQKIDQSTSLEVGVDQQEKVGNNHALDVGKAMHLKAGEKIVMEAGQSLTIGGPGGFIHIHSGGIDIVGRLVNINSGGSRGEGQGSSPTAPTDAEEAFPKDNWEDIEKTVK